MCWKSKNKPVRCIADEDIKVKKILRLEEDQLYSPIFREYHWNFGEVNLVHLGEPGIEHYHGNGLKPPAYYFITEGFSSCEFINKEWDTWRCFHNGEFHELFGAVKSETICNAVIPKGANYYLNERGEYISDKLRITGIPEIGVMVD